MFDYINGIVSKTVLNYVVVDCSGVGYKIYTPNPYKFKEGETSKIYVYNHIREDENVLYGFSSEDERDLFLKLINVKGLGPKMALPMLAAGKVEGIVDAIERENILYLKKFPKIGDKVARQIILDLKGKLVNKEESSKVNEELVLALNALGYKNSDINKVVKNVPSNLKIEDQIKEALKLLLK